MFFASESIKLYNNMKVFTVSYKLCQSYYLKIPPLDISPKEIKICVLKKTYTGISMPSREKQRNKIRYIRAIEHCSETKTYELHDIYIGKSQKHCLVKETRHKVLYSVWFHLHIFQEQANIINASREKLFVMMIVHLIGISYLG